MKSKYLNRSGRLLLAAVCSTLCLGRPAMAASPVGDIVGKTVVGYQGWFSASDNSPNGNWSHLSNNGQSPGPTTCVLVSWPDMRDYTTTYQTAFANLGNGQPAKLFSSWDQSSVTIHFQWMQQNGIDGAALQRFASWVNPGSTRLQQDDGIAARVKTAAEATGRKFFIMYDCSGSGPITNDWASDVVNTLHLTSSSAYAKQNGKPVVCLWDVGNGTMSTASWIATINFYKNAGCYVIGGVKHTWTGTWGGTNGPVYRACNCIQPWVIGSMADLAAVQYSYINHAIPDEQWCQTNGIDYQRTICPEA